MAAREETWSFINIRRRCEATVQELISRTDAIVLFGYPEATILAISCSRGLSSDRGTGAFAAQGEESHAPDFHVEKNLLLTGEASARPPVLAGKG